MSRTPRNHLLCLVSLAVLVCVTSAFLITRASIDTSAPATQVAAPAQVERGPRNLFLQPEALRVSRRLGKRFGPSSRAASVLTGIVTIAASEQPVTITRSKSEKGENVELLVASRGFTWGAEEGTRAASGTPTDLEHLLIERLVYDSPDYFVLAQLRGASYFTVAQNVRPENAPDNYDGPLWTVVRIDDPQSNQAARPKSSWRLYYINSQTGLIDRIVSHLNDETVEAQITSWTEQSGEKTPSQITWSVAGRAVMSYQVTSVSHINS
jgi:hypothetical protein